MEALNLLQILENKMRQVCGRESKWSSISEVVLVRDVRIFNLIRDIVEN